MKLLFYALSLFMLVACAEKKAPDNPNQPAPAEQTTKSGDSASQANNPIEKNENSVSGTDAAKISDGTTGQLTTPAQGQAASGEESPKLSPELIKEILRVLDLMSKDKVELNHNNKMLPGPEASKFLKNKFLAKKTKINSWDDFIREVALEVLSSGKPFTVSTSEKKNFPLSDYLNNLHNAKK